MSWVYRGPAMAVGSGGRETISGLGTIRYALGPLNRPAKPKQEKPPKKPLWRRLLWRKK